MVRLRIRNLTDAVPAELPEELCEDLARGEGVRIERIVSQGHASPAGFWYDQDEIEWVLLLAGAARLEVEGRRRPIELQPGDALEIPAHARHRVAWTDPERSTIWLAVFYRRDPPTS